MSRTTQIATRKNCQAVGCRKRARARLDTTVLTYDVGTLLCTDHALDAEYPETTDDVYREDGDGRRTPVEDKIESRDWQKPATLNGARIERRSTSYGDTIFIALPPHAWTPIGSTGTGPACCCKECKNGALPVYDTLVVRAEHEPGHDPDYATTCHYPEFSQAKRCAPDVRIEDHGTVALFILLTDDARTWIDENVEHEPWQWMGSNLAVGHRYAENLAAGMRQDGLEVAHG